MMANPLQQQAGGSSSGGNNNSAAHHQRQRPSSSYKLMPPPPPPPAAGDGGAGGEKAEGDAVAAGVSIRATTAVHQAAPPPLNNPYHHAAAAAAAATMSLSSPSPYAERKVFGSTATPSSSSFSGSGKVAKPVVSSSAALSAHLQHPPAIPELLEIASPVVKGGGGSVGMTDLSGSQQTAAANRRRSSSYASAAGGGISGGVGGIGGGGGGGGGDELHAVSPPPPPAASVVADVVERKVKRNLWRDFLFLVGLATAMTAIGYVETHAGDSESRHASGIGNHGIIDTGFNVTVHAHLFLKMHKRWNDVFALLNSIALVLPITYGIRTVLKRGDYSWAFRILFAELLRSLCGWCTYLPPSSSYLASNFDFPDVLECLFAVRDCSSSSGGSKAGGDDEEEEVLPFVSFFSGHVAIMVITANHMYLNGYVRTAATVHALNVLQILRLLATRGHYSIDVIIGWVVATSVSQPAGRLGRYYSRGDYPLKDIVVPSSAQHALEVMMGVRDERNEHRMSALLKHADAQQVLRAVQDECQGLLDDAAAAGGGGGHDD